MKASWVVLTTGERPREVDAALASIAAQEGVDQEMIVVANGGPVTAPADVRVVELPENTGIPGGRNAGIRVAAGDVVFFLDDDARVADPDLARRALEAFAAEPRLGIVSFRIADPETGDTERRHVPRLRAGDAAHSGPVTTFLGGACAIRGAVVDQVGAYPEEFFYAMEETDLAWRALDAGWEIDYRGDLVVHHPGTKPTRHPDALWRTARNRVWLARRRLPWVLAAVYLTVWTTAMLARTRSPRGAGQVTRGLRAGFREPAGERAPMSWGTAWRMTRLGRPPIV